MIIIIIMIIIISSSSSSSSISGGGSSSSTIIVITITCNIILHDTYEHILYHVMLTHIERTRAYELLQDGPSINETASV